LSYFKNNASIVERCYEVDPGYISAINSGISNLN